jgi:hypothetical protein
LLPLPCTCPHGLTLQSSRFPLEDHLHLPFFKASCGRGCGLAACPTLNLLVTSDLGKNTLSVWGLPSGTSGGGASGGAGSSAGGASSADGGGWGLRLVCTLGGARSAAPMRFWFEDGLGYSGYLAFTPPTTMSGSCSVRPLLLVTDAGHDAVHLVDVVGASPRWVRCAPRVHLRAPGRGGKLDLPPGGRQRVEGVEQR